MPRKASTVTEDAEKTGESTQENVDFMPEESVPESSQNIPQPGSNLRNRHGGYLRNDTKPSEEHSLPQESSHRNFRLQHFSIPPE